MGANGNLVEMAGRRFGALTVVERGSRHGRRSDVWWRCRCDCGAECEARGDRLRAGAKRACGVAGHRAGRRAT